MCNVRSAVLRRRGILSLHGRDVRNGTTRAGDSALRNENKRQSHIFLLPSADILSKMYKKSFMTEFFLITLRTNVINFALKTREVLKDELQPIQLNT